MSRPIRVVGAVTGALVAVVASLSISYASAAAAVPLKDTAIASIVGAPPGPTGPGATGATGAPATLTPSTATPATAGGSTTSTTVAGGSATLNLGGSLAKPSNSLTIVIGLTLLSLAPALLIMLTSFTRIIIVLSLTRNALGLQSVPPNQVLVGLALFLSLFIMSPTLKAMNTAGIQPYLHGRITQTQAYDRSVAPLKTWMLKQTDANAIGLFDQGKKVASPEQLSMVAVVPSFIVSELKSGFIIGFVIFVPFLVIDLLVSSTLMSMGMMMLPPTLVSLPFKLLLFVLVNGWALVVSSLVTSFH